MYAAAEKVPFIPCKDSTSILGVAIDPCNSIDIDGWKTCVIPRQTVIRVQAAVLPPFDALDLETVVSAAGNSHLIHLPHSGINPCVENIMPSCPLIKHKMYIITSYFDVFPYQPSAIVIQMTNLHFFPSKYVTVVYKTFL
ncbi:ML domain-containing protein [Caerostris darwini]|uniref:ML domain-containing protein n=1 Tax=Caerostris darwini TaxID=1538125 RepID=A0AAV4SF30_9ARAC|nr:ML domain-containing protein [Caerostris darwini]